MLYVPSRKIVEHVVGVYEDKMTSPFFTVAICCRECCKEPIPRKQYLKATFWD